MTTSPPFGKQLFRVLPSATRARTLIPAVFEPSRRTQEVAHPMDSRCCGLLLALCSPYSTGEPSETDTLNPCALSAADSCSAKVSGDPSARSVHSHQGVLLSMPLPYPFAQ